MNSTHNVEMGTLYEVECHEHFHSDGSRCDSPLECDAQHTISLKWKDSFHNLVVTEGLNELLDRLVKNVPANVNWYVGLKGTGNPAAGDTMGSHGTWSEITPYSNATRPAFTAGAISGGSVDNSAAKAVFGVNATSTVYGAFMSSDNTKGGTSGKLYGAGNFSSSRAVESGDTLNVTVTLSATAS